MSVSRKKSRDPKTKPTIMDGLRQARNAGMNIHIHKNSIEISPGVEKEKKDPKASLSQISPEEEKQIEQEMKELLKPKGEKNAYSNNDSDSR